LKPTSVTSEKLANWKTHKINAGQAPVEIMVGMLPANANLDAYAKTFAPLGKASFTVEKQGIRMTLALSTTKADASLKALWAAGYTDAFALR
jgi:hypothetical protein